MAGKPDPAWQQLGQALQRRRVELDLRFKNMALFAREHGLNERLVFDIENGRRTGYRPTTRRALEIAYQLDSGWIDRFVAGQPAPMTDGDFPPPHPASDDGDDAVWASATPEQRRTARAFIETMQRLAAERDRDRNGGERTA